MVKSAVLFITFHCNFQCPYCWERQAQKHGEMTAVPFIHWEKWLEALNRLDIETLDISGGEPLLQPGICELIGRLNSRRVAITSNLSFNMTEFIKKIPAHKICSMTASYHPTSELSLELFTGKVLLLREHGIPITVNFVGYPEQMYLIPQIKAHFENLGVRFHVDPYAPTKFNPYHFSAEEQEFLSKYVGSDRKPFDGKREGVKKCSGGVNHLNIQPNGDAYRCIKDKVEGAVPIGNVFSPDFKLNESSTDCKSWWDCPGCDRDKVTVQ